MSETPDFHAPQRGGQQPDNVIPRFYMRAEQNNFKSREAGRPIFDDLEYVEIRVPGDRNSVVDRPVLDEHRRRWPAHYAAFQSKREAPVEGTPLIEWPQVTRGQAEELAYFHVKTVEQLAGLSDEQLSKCWPMGGREIRAAAQRFLDAANGAAPAEKLAAENAAQKATIDELQKTVKDLAQKVEELSKPATPA